MKKILIGLIISSSITIAGCNKTNSVEDGVPNNFEIVSIEKIEDIKQGISFRTYILKDKEYSQEYIMIEQNVNTQNRSITITKRDVK